MDSIIFNSIKNCDTLSISKRLDSGVSINQKDKNGATALMWGVYYCDLRLVKYLVRHGAEFGPSDGGYLQDGSQWYGSLLCIAAAKGKIKLFEFFIDSLKLDINEIHVHPVSKGHDGMTALSAAVVAGQLAMVTYILDRGGNCDIVDCYGTSIPLFLAAQYEHWEIFDLLLKIELEKGSISSIPPGIIVEEQKLKRLYPISKKSNKAPELESFIVQLKKLVLGDSSIGYASSLNNLATSYLGISQYSKAESLYLKAKSIFQKLKREDHPNYPIMLNMLGYCYFKWGDYNKSIPELVESMAITKKYLGEDNESNAGSLILLGLVNAQLGKYDKAKDYYEQAMILVKKIKGPQDPLYAIILNNYAFLYSNLGQHNDALPLYIEASNIMKKKYNQNQYDFEGNLIDIANSYFKLGDYKQALPLFEKAINFTKRTLGTNNENYALQLNGLATLYQTLGKYEDAVPLFKESLEIIKKVLGDSDSRYSLVLNNLASAYESTGRYSNAENLLRNALTITKKTLGEEHQQYAQHLNDLAILFINRKQFYRALELFQKSQTILKNAVGQTHPLYASNLNDQGNIYFYLKKYDSASLLYKQALDIRIKMLGKDHPDNVASLNGLGLVNSIKGNEREASNLLIAANLIELDYLAKTYTTLSEQEKMILLNKELFQFGYLPTLLYRGYSEKVIIAQVFNNELILKGMVAQDKKEVLNTIRKNGDSLTLALYKSWQFNNNLIGKQDLLPISQRVPNLDSLKRIKNEQEQELSRNAASFYQNLTAQHLTGKDISRNLKSGEAAIEFIKFKLFTEKESDSIIYAAIVLLPGDTIGTFIHLFEEKQLANLLRPYSGSTTSFSAIQRLYKAGSFSDSLYKLIWKPLEHSLADAKTIYFAPTGLLHRISFQAIYYEPGHLLIDKYKLNQMLSTRSIAQPSRIDSKAGLVNIWGSIQYDGVDLHIDSIHKKSNAPPQKDTSTGQVNVYALVNRASPGKEWKPLAGSRIEIVQIQKLLAKAGVSTRIDSGYNALEESFKEFDGSSPKVIHVATHGFFLPVAQSKPKKMNELTRNAFSLQQNPMFRSGLVLAGGNEAWKGKVIRGRREDGILTAYEIAQMDLSNTDLVVLSACETGLGDLQGNEGVIGLQRAFKMAGVKQMIMSLWKVPDHETMELMTDFYTNWLNGQTPRDALRSAQLKMRENHTPYYWAAFVLVE